MIENNILGVVLAGGKSKRFGDDKTTAKLGNKSLLDHTIEKIEKKFDEILIISNNEKHISIKKNVFSTKDLIEGHLGPLVGVLSAMEWIKKHKKNYKKFIMNLKNVLPCGHCRKNFPKNLKSVPLNSKTLKNRDNFSRWMYDLHEEVNKMLHKKSGLSYEQVRDRYEHFRSRCTKNPPKTKIMLMKKRRKTRKKKKEKGCTEPLFGKKA